MVRLTAVLVLVIVLTGCSVTFDAVLGSNSTAPMNEGPRGDLVLDSVQGGWSSDVDMARSTIRSTWAGDERLRSWFVLVDRVEKPADTAFLNAHVGTGRSDRSRIGTPKHGYTTIFHQEIEVTFELVDGRTGVVMASGTGEGRSSRSGSPASKDEALRDAIDAGLNRLVRNYAGEAE